MYSFKELRKGSKLEIDGDEIRSAILGNCSTQFLTVALSGYSKLIGINNKVFDADYNQIDAQLLNEKSEVYSFQPDYIVLWLDTYKLYEDFLDTDISERKLFAETIISKIKFYWGLIIKNSSARILQMNFTEIDDKVLGQYSAKIPATFTYQIRKLNFLLEEAMEQNMNVYPIDLLAIQIRMGQSEFFDASYYYNAKMSASIKALPYISKAIVDVIKSMIGKIKKCVVLDLDNTLWGGVIGDDGINNIEIGDLKRGHVFTNFQKWLKQLKEYGIILAVCSKNNESIAKEPFEKCEDMILKLSDIAVFVANWDDKASNIKLIQESLNIGMDSIIFIDDNPFERNLVRQIIPEIEVPELPEDPAHYLEYLQQCNYFETVSFSENNSDRTKLYQAEFDRKKSEAQYSSIDDYLKSLEMVGEGKSFEESQYSRIAQLTQRSNQFNLRTIRYSENEIKKISEDDSYFTQYYKLKDKFGDHGLVGVVIIRKEDKKTLFIDTWLMSCRVLKRGMEEFIINKIIDKAKKMGFEVIEAEYIPTKKNEMVKDIYLEMGFTEYEVNHYRININKYKKRKVYIKDEES